MTRPPRSEVLGLLADVKKDPADLTPWLVLCDWLEENGDEVDRARGEYSRLCFDKLGKKTYASDWERGERRRELYRQYHREWLGPVARLKVTVRRGLLEVEASGDDFLEVSEAGVDVESWGWVETLKAHTLRRSQALTLASCPLLAGPTQIELAFLWGEKLDLAGAKALAQSPYLANVRSLKGVLGTEKVRQAIRQVFKDRFGDAAQIR